MATTGTSRARDRGLAHLVPLMQAKGVTVEPAEFQQTINLVFHGFESHVYDRIHRDMRASLPRHFEAFAARWLAHGGVPDTLTVLDIGCGTGLSSELLLATAVGSRITRLDLLDTSPEMLARCDARPALEKVERRLLRGTLTTIAPKPVYDLILACSVLHHIPDLDTLLAQVVERQAPSGAFFHLQDPNGDYLEDAVLRERTEACERLLRGRAPAWLKRLRPGRVARRLWSEVSGAKNKSYIDRVNDELLRRGLIQEPLSENELWQVTDIHVYDGAGVSLNHLRGALPSYDLIAARSYSFFGTLYSDLPPALQREEDRLLAAGAVNGLHVGALWCKRPAL